MNRNETGTVTLIEPSNFWSPVNLAELIARRELLYFLVWRDVKIRYKQTAIGVAWAVLQPVMSTAIFTVLFSRFAGFDTGSIPYPIFALSGLMIWLFVQSSITMASSSFVGNTNLVTKIYFPRLILPLAATIACVVDLLVSFVILVVLVVYYGVVPTRQILWVPVFVTLALILASSFGLLFSALNVRFRDVKFALPFLLQVWMIASPIFYPTAILPEKSKLIYALNPLSGIVEGLRSALFGTPFDWQTIAISSLTLGVLTLLSLLVFRWMEDSFADLI